MRARDTTGLCFDIQRYAIHDGPGIRTSVFLKGCPLACDWCHNPEGRAEEVELIRLPAHCVRCGACLEACPNPSVEGPDGDPETDPARCSACGSCVEACVAGARRLAGERFTVDELLERVERDRAFHEESGGGVTFTGGEPLAQGEFLLACLQACRERGIHTAVDTCGFAPRELVLECARWTGLFLYDLKTADEERHQQRAGTSAAPILENLRALDAAGARIWIRVPLIPGFNDDPASLEAIGRFAASLRATRRVHVLPFHRNGECKYHSLQRGAGAVRHLPLAGGAVEEAVEILAACDLDVHTGG